MRKRARAFDVHAFLNKAGLSKRIVEYPRAAVIFTQGDPCDSVVYIQEGTVKLSVLSKSGREAVVALLGPGDFFGDGCIAGERLRMASATALTHGCMLIIKKQEMLNVLHKQRTLAHRFIGHLLSRNLRIQQDLIDQLFNSTEKRLARTLLLLARYSHEEAPLTSVPKISQKTLAEMVGTTRSQVNVLMNRFKKLGYVDYGGDVEGRIRIDSSLITVVLHD